MVLLVELLHTEPKVWRRISVDSSLPLPQLHLTLQIAMGWENAHLHSFETGDGNVVSAEKERRLTVGHILRQQGDEAFYLYDFGDSWMHLVTVESVGELGDERPARLLDGAGACPPEDSGGLPGYDYLIEALKDPGHAEHAEMSEWFEEMTGTTAADFDPGHVDVERADGVLARVIA